MPYAVDFETYYDDEVSIKTLGAYNYLRHPKMDIYLVAIHGPNGSWEGRPEDFQWEAIAGEDWLSHNAGFDALVYERLKEVFPDLPWPDPPAWHCTADLAVYVGAGRALKSAAKQLLQVEVSKAYRNVMKGRHFRDLTAQETHQVLEAGRADAINCWRLWEQYASRWPENERRLSLLTRQMGWRGVAVDVPGLEAAQQVLGKLLWTAEQKIPWAGEKDEKGKDIPLLSAKVLAAQCRKEGIPAPASMSKDDPDFDEWLTQYGAKYQWAGAVSEYRRINTVAERVDAMLARVQPNGRMGYGWKYFGAHTGRWSGDGGVNVQNQMKNPLFVKTDLTVVREQEEIDRLTGLFADGEPMPDDIKHVIDLRSMIVAPKGQKLGIVDLSQIEPRILWWLTGDQVSLDLAASGMSPYEVHARASMSWTGGDLKKEDKRGYALAKARVLALGYGAGWLKFFAMAKMYGVKPEVFDDPLTPAEITHFEEYLQALKNKDGWLAYSGADDTHKRRYGNSWKIVNDFRETNPKTVGLWNKLDYGFKVSRGKDFEVELPSGRTLRYRNVSGHAGWTAEVISSLTGQLSRKNFYGGKLCENLDQATARDAFADATLRCVDKGYIPVLSVHDELVFELDEAASLQPIIDEMSVTPAWLPGCPLACEGSTSPFYCK